MEKEYEPRISETLRAIASDIPPAMGKSYRVSRAFAGSLLRATAAVYALPTTGRMIDESKFPKDFGTPEHEAREFGSGLGCAAGFAQLGAHAFLIEEFGLKVAGPIAITNLLSQVYETYRAKRNELSENSRDE